MEREYLEREIAKLEEELKEPIRLPVDRDIHNKREAWLQYFKKQLTNIN